MKNYQLFVRFFKVLDREFMETGLDNLDIHMIKKNRLRYYKEIGLKDDDAIKQYEHRKSKELHDNLNLGLELAHIFEIDTIIKRYLILNRPPQTKEFYKKATLPFKAMFLDIEITKDDYDIGVDKINGIMVTETPIIEHNEDSKGIKFKKVGMGYRVHYLCFDKGGVFVDEFKIILDNTKIPIFYDDKKTLRFLKEFIMNLLVFINDREIVVIEKKRSRKNIERRIRQGKMPLPDSRAIRLTGTLKRYIDGLGSRLSGNKYSYRFWVRGHMRYLASDRYKNKKGQWIKIEPFIKGEGALIKRFYRVTDDKEDERIKELKDENLFFDDIKPAKKSLVKMLR